MAVAPWLRNLCVALALAGAFNLSACATGGLRQTTSDPTADPASSSGTSRSSGTTMGSEATSGTLTFHGYECTVDCSGHEAGYQWAEEHDITDPDDCGGNSESFIEGCKAYAEEHTGHQGDEMNNEDNP